MSGKIENCGGGIVLWPNAFESWLVKWTMVCRHIVFSLLGFYFMCACWRVIIYYFQILCNTVTVSNDAHKYGKDMTWNQSEGSSRSRYQEPFVIILVLIWSLSLRPVEKEQVCIVVLNDFTLVYDDGLAVSRYNMFIYNVYLVRLWRMSLHIPQNRHLRWFPTTRFPHELYTASV